MTMHSGSTASEIGVAKRVRSKDLFEKCSSFTRPADLQAAGLYMDFEVFGEPEGCDRVKIRMGNRKVLMFGSNDYLNLITHPKVLEAATNALHRYGSGCSGSRRPYGEARFTPQPPS